MNYFDIKAISNSSLNYIDPKSGGSPRYFRKFLDGELEEKSSSSFEIGTLIHEELLEPGKIDIIAEATPGPKTQDIIQALFNRLYAEIPVEDIPVTELDTYSEETWQAVIPADFYPKYNLQTKINRIVKDGGEYWKCLCTSAGKLIVDPATYHVVRGCIESIQLHTIANELISGMGFENYDESQEEMEITFDLPWDIDDQTVTLPIKAKLDRVLISHEHKSISLVDLKTTRSPIGTFEQTFTKYRYYRQLAFYCMCLKQAYPDYKIGEVFIVAVQTNKEYPADVYKIDDTYLAAGEDEYIELLNRCAFHLARNNWGNSMETQLGMINSLVLQTNDYSSTDDQA